MALEILLESALPAMSPGASGPLRHFVVPGLLLGVGQPRKHPGSGLPGHPAVSVQKAHSVTGFFEFSEDLGDQLRPNDDLTPFMIWRAPPSDRSADSN
jgi:hypothetical protein